MRGSDGDFAAWPAAIALESDPGDAVIFNIKVYHAALGDDHGPAQHKHQLHPEASDVGARRVPNFELRIRQPALHARAI